MEINRQLAIPLKQSQIDAAKEFWVSGGWESKEFEQLRVAFPNPLDGVKIKAIVVNELYATNIFAIQRVAERVERVLKANQWTGPDLVEHLVTEIREVTKRNHYSFAAKYAHFFVDSTLPILDWFAEWMLGRHLGRQVQSKDARRYHRFTQDIETLKLSASLNCNCAELDAYLWVAGEYWYWIQHPQYNINGDLKRQFKNLQIQPQNAMLLAALLDIRATSPGAGIPSRD
jgi:hypothetical protein